jgi:hypothetical protein
MLDIPFMYFLSLFCVFFSGANCFADHFPLPKVTAMTMIYAFIQGYHSSRRFIVDESQLMQLFR